MALCILRVLFSLMCVPVCRQLSPVEPGTDSLKNRKHFGEDRCTRNTKEMQLCLILNKCPIIERQQLGIHGLLPPCFISQDIQLLRVLKNYDMKRDDLDR
uniref:Secreted protein n=1 Tax=Periophthalmus magnuspinnatus TaxID=409849 RepID=A0A3B4A747_9GOBI